VQPVLGGGVSRSVSGLVPGHRAQEHVAFEREEPHTRRRGDGGRSRNVSEQGDLADVIAWSEPRYVGPARGHVSVAVGDHVDAIADVSFADHDGARGHDDRDAVACEALERRRRERFEQRRPAEKREVLGRDPRADVNGSESPAEREAHDGDDRAGDHEGPSGAERRQEGRTGERAQALAPHVHGLEHAE